MGVWCVQQDLSTRRRARCLVRALHQATRAPHFIPPPPCTPQPRRARALRAGAHFLGGCTSPPWMVYLSHFLAGSYTSQREAGNMCLLRSYLREGRGVSD